MCEVQAGQPGHYNRRGATDFWFLFVNNNKLIEKRTKKVDFFLAPREKKINISNTKTSF